MSLANLGELPFAGPRPERSIAAGDSSGFALGAGVALRGRANMRHNFSIQIITPVALIGLLVLAASVIGAWYVDRLQSNRIKIILRDVASLRTAQDLETDLRQLRFHTLLYLMKPDSERFDRMQQDHVGFLRSLARARELADTVSEQTFLRSIETSYQLYYDEVLRKCADVANHRKQFDVDLVAEIRPIQRLVEPCQAFFAANLETMEQTSQESDRMVRQAHAVMLLLGLAGPLGGLTVGYSVARGLSRSIYRLSVRVGDIMRQFDQEVGVVQIAADGDLRKLEQHLNELIQRVRTVMETLHRHQRELLRTEQLSAVGQLAAGVAHEIRNPLTSMKVLVEVALRHRNPRPFTRENLQVLHEQIVRLEHTVQEFLDFARPPQLQQGDCDLRDVVAQAVTLVQPRAARQQIALDVSCPDFPVVRAVDRGQLCTVLVNLCLNAVEALPKGGQINLQLECLPDNAVRLAVADTGPGISDAMKGRLFTPFASTKPTGTGLGLCISRRIVEDHGGRLEANNLRRGGACFSIILPPAK